MGEREEVIYWGPNNARTVRLGLEVAPRTADFTVDDIYGTGKSYRVVLDMYEEDGSWLRTLAVAPWIDYIEHGVLIFEPLGIALISPFTGMNMPHGQQPYGPPHQGAGPAQSGGSRSGTQPSRAVGGARDGSVAPQVAPDLQPLPHTLSAIQKALMGGK